MCDENTPLGELQVRYSQGDSRAAEELWRRYEWSFVAQANRLAYRDPDIAQSAVNDLHWKNHAPHFQSKYRPPGSWRAWMGTVLVHFIRRASFQKLSEWFELTPEESFQRLERAGVPQSIQEQLRALIGRKFWSRSQLLHAVDELFDDETTGRWREEIATSAWRTRQANFAEVREEFHSADPRTSSPDEQAMQREFSEHLRQALPDCARKLPVTERRALYFKIRRRMTLHQVAEALSLTNQQGKPDTNKAHQAITKATKQLRDCLTKKWKLGDES